MLLRIVEMIPTAKLIMTDTDSCTTIYQFYLSCWMVATGLQQIPCRLRSIVFFPPDALPDTQLTVSKTLVIKNSKLTTASVVSEM